MATSDCKLSVDFKARIYDRYLTQTVRLSDEMVQTALRQRGPYLRSIISSFLPQDKQVRILDLGCGYGAMLHTLRAAGYTRLTGVDGAPEQVAQARRLGFEDVHEHDLRAYLDGVAESSFDAVVAFDVLEHFSRGDLFALVDEIHRVLAPGGRLILHLPNAEGIFCGSILYGDMTHEMAFTRSSLRQLAGACGFRVIAFKEELPIAHGLVSFCRLLIWRTGSFFFRLLAAAETGGGFRDKPLTQNLVAVLERG